MVLRRPLATLAAAGALVLALLGAGTDSAAASPAQATANPLTGNGMWIWYVSRSHGGNVDAIAARAHRSNITTVFVKSGDAAKPWSQFNPGLINALHARGLKVCAWQFIYGVLPYAEADVGAASVAAGADCLVLDVEGQYEGKYASADRFMQSLRARVGADYPLGLASFPYTDYHPALPYSVFLGPNGAQYNLPQMYWKAIGTSVAAVFAHTFQFNRPYGRPIAPLGQTYANPRPKQVRKFRRWALSYNSLGVSWWSWQSTGKKQWRALRGNVAPLGAPPVLYPTLTVGSKGDLVVWAQQHLDGAGFTTPIGGIYSTTTAASVSSFQTSRGIPATGIIDANTWPALLAVAPTYVAWGTAGYAPARSAAAGGGIIAPDSAGLPAVRDEIPGPRRRR
ncbi:MAG: peptidoglycan-binding protein [Solirubrobacterales bacterium]